MLHRELRTLLQAIEHLKNVLPVIIARHRPLAVQRAEGCGTAALNVGKARVYALVDEGLCGRVRLEVLHLRPDSRPHIGENGSGDGSSRCSKSGEVALVGLDRAAESKPTCLLHGLTKHDFGLDSFGLCLLNDDLRERIDGGRPF